MCCLWAQAGNSCCAGGGNATGSGADAGAPGSDALELRFWMTRHYGRAWMTDVLRPVQKFNTCIGRAQSKLLAILDEYPSSTSPPPLMLPFHYPALLLPPR